MARCPNFTLMKGEGPVAVVRRYVEALGPQLAILNGRGGLELPDNLRAGCVGMVPAPDCADVQAVVYRAWQMGDDAFADGLYERALPYIVFAMQTIDVAIQYGKRMFIKRAGIDNAGVCRAVRGAPDPFLLAAMDRWGARFGDYGAGL